MSVNHVSDLMLVCTLLPVKTSCSVHVFRLLQELKMIGKRGYKIGFFGQNLENDHMNQSFSLHLVKYHEDDETMVKKEKSKLPLHNSKDTSPGVF